MKRHYSIRIGASIRFVVVPLMSAAVLLSSVGAVAEGPIPFKAMMQSAGAQSAVPPKSQSGQQVQPGPITSAGKAEIAGGFLLVGVGIITITATAVLNTSGYTAAGAKTPALYGVGAGAAAVGVTLIALGFHRHR